MFLVQDTVLISEGQAADYTNHHLPRLLTLTVLFLVAEDLCLLPIKHCEHTGLRSTHHWIRMNWRDVAEREELFAFLHSYTVFQLAHL